MNAPPKRGFSFMEMWIIGMEIPTIIAMLTSGYLMLKLRYFENSKVKSMEYNEEEFLAKLRNYDMIICGSLAFYFFTFFVVFVIVALSQ